ncbi:MAG: hypothetical protein K1W28_09050 [Lachnospiraceae bacterium]
MDSWNRFVHTGDIRDYLAYKKEETGAGGTGDKHEQSDLYGDRYRFVCQAGGGI